MRLEIMVGRKIDSELQVMLPEYFGEAIVETVLTRPIIHRKARIPPKSGRIGHASETNCRIQVHGVVLWIDLAHVITVSTLGSLQQLVLVVKLRFTESGSSYGDFIQQGRAECVGHVVCEVGVRGL